MNHLVHLVIFEVGEFVPSRSHSEFAALTVVIVCSSSDVTFLDRVFYQPIFELIPATTLSVVDLSTCMCKVRMIVFEYIGNILSGVFEVQTEDSTRKSPSITFRAEVVTNTCVTIARTVNDVTRVLVEIVVDFQLVFFFGLFEQVTFKRHVGIFLNSCRSKDFIPDAEFVDLSAHVGRFITQSEASEIRHLACWDVASAWH